MIYDPKIYKLQKKLSKALKYYDAAVEAGRTITAKRHLKKAEQFYKLIKDILGG